MLDEPGLEGGGTGAWFPVISKCIEELYLDSLVFGSRWILVLQDAHSTLKFS